MRTARKPYKAVLANTASDSEGVINFTASGIVVGTKAYTTSEYTARLAGILAGISLAQSATYYVLDEVTSVDEKDEPDTAVDNGELFLINDGEKIKLSRAVNSKKTIGTGENAELKKIKIADGVDMIRSDIMTMFSDGYVGKVANSYDNKVAFCAAVNTYLSDIASEGVLYDEYDNKVSVDIAAQTKYLKENGVDVSAMSEEEIKKSNTGAKVFVSGSIQFQDTMEDLSLTFTM